MAEPTLQEIGDAVAELRREVETKSKDVLSESKLEKINLVLDGWEDTQVEVKALEGIRENHETAIKELTEFKAIRAEDVKLGAELKQQVHDLELEVARGTRLAVGTDFRDTPEYKALNGHCRMGDRQDVEEKALLRTDSAVDGGVLTTVELDGELQRKITEIDGIRAIARVRSTGAAALDIAIRNVIPTATYEGEADTGADSVSTYQKETLTPYRQTFTAPITLDQLMDSAFDMDSEIASDAALAFGFGEGNGFVAGTGDKQPQGFTIKASLRTAARTIAGGTVTADSVILLTGDLKVGYNPSYVLNRRMLAILRTLKSTTGSFLWQPGLNGPVMNTLNGFPYTVANSMEDEAVGAYPIAFGDFRAGYTIVDRTGFTVIRDEYTQKKLGIVEFTMNRWNTGQVTLDEAIKLLKVLA